ncbi:MAG: hypothetical protein KatS3mg105_0403 [Gemmatales bacterium]|nr:MAG: hypothetical protein KatS3mg105_0403 [Gemmatales bacterium]
MIGKMIDWCLDNRFLVCLLAAIVALIGVWALTTIPIDAIPDLSDVQVIIYTPWPGRDPQTIEDQVTYPLTTAMLSVAGVADVRGYSFFGFSFVYVIFEDGTDIYWARSRVMEYLNQVHGRLPEGATPQLGPDASGLGWVYIYTLEDTQNRYDLSQLRALQDWYVRYRLTEVKGVAEVASVGGAVRQYEVAVDPHRLLLYQIPLESVIAGIQRSNNDVGGRVVEISETEHMVRGLGYIRNTQDFERIVLSATKDGTPILLRDVAEVHIGPDIKRGLADKNGQGEVVAGVVVMRYGENALEVIAAVKERLRQLAAGLPDGVIIRTAYDRSPLVYRAIHTLQWTLTEELIITAAICLIFLLHLRSAAVAVIVLPLGILVSFMVMNVLGINANIMSLAGIAVAIGTMVDASVVVVENVHKHKEKAPPGTDHWQLVSKAAREVGPGLFVSLLVVTVSFCPVFVLQGQSGRLFKPLAYTKTFAMAASALIAVTLIPVLAGFFVRGPIRSEKENPINRWTIGLYLPVIRFALRHKKLSMAMAFLLLAASQLPLLQVVYGKWIKEDTPVVGPALHALLRAPWIQRLQLGEEFMPPLQEGDILYMPTTIPGLSVTEARRTLQIQDRLLAQFPEVRVVLGKVGRADTPTDPAPLNMVETHVSLRPQEDWPKRLIPKGFLRKLAHDMLVDSTRSEWLESKNAAFTPQELAQEVENKVRWELNRQTRIELAQYVNANLGQLRQGLDDQKREAEQSGRPWTFRVDDEALEDRWAADLLHHKMRQIRSVLPKRIVHRLSIEIADRFIERAIVASGDRDKFVAFLQQRWQGRLAVDAIPLVATTFHELTDEEMQRTLTIPGMPNWWLQPIETRIGMLTTGMRGVLGLKLYGDNLDQLSALATRLEKVLRDVPGTVSVVAERAMGGHYLDIKVDRYKCARHGLKVGDVQRMIETGIGGMTISATVEGRYRFPVIVRYPRELRDDPERLKRTLVATPQGNSIPLGQIADIEFVDGPPVVKSEGGTLLINIPIAIERSIDIGSYVREAQTAIDRAIARGEVRLPAGYYIEWSGQYEMMQQFWRRLLIVGPLTLAVIFLLIYLNMRNIVETAITMLTLPFALIGGIWAMYFWGWYDSGQPYSVSVAVVIGFIALAGLAAETGIIMHVYLDLAYRQHRNEKGRRLTQAELEEAVIEGAVLRVRPKLMTVLTDFLALLPVLWMTTAGAEPMKRIAIPLIGGVITSAIHTLVLVPVYYTLYKTWRP